MQNRFKSMVCGNGDTTSKEFRSLVDSNQRGVLQ